MRLGDIICRLGGAVLGHIWLLLYFIRKEAGAPNGLRNLGQTCFMNAALQAVASCKPFCDWLSKCGDPRLEIFSKILQDVNTGGGKTVDAADLLKIVDTKNMTVPHAQQDCNEMFQALMEFVDNGLTWQAPGKADRGPHPFRGCQLIHLACAQCRNVLPPTESYFNSLSLVVHKDKTTLTEMFQHYTRQVEVGQVTCEHCEGVDDNGVKTKSTYTKQVQLSEPPDCLCIHVDSIITTGGFLRKNANRFKFGDLKLEGDVLTKRIHTGESVFYRLQSVVVHHGLQSCGHYIAYRRGIPPDDHNWFYTSDNHVTSCTEDVVTHQKPYMLLYTREQSN